MPNMCKDTLPERERLLSAAAHLQRIISDAVLVGGTASALYASHRLSVDADHVLKDLRSRFDAVLIELESVSGWITARTNRPGQILGSLDGIETGIRQLIRQEPLETRQIEYYGESITIPTLSEMLRIKAVLILKRNATRDYLLGIALGWYVVALSGLRKKISEFFGNVPNLKCFFHLIHLFQRNPGSNQK